MKGSVITCTLKLHTDNPKDMKLVALLRSLGDSKSRKDVLVDGALSLSAGKTAPSFSLDTTQLSKTIADSMQQLSKSINDSMAIVAQSMKDISVSPVIASPVQSSELESDMLMSSGSSDCPVEPESDSVTSLKSSGDSIDVLKSLKSSFEV